MLLNCGVGEDSRVPWTARRSNQSILKEISPEYSLQGLMLKLQYFGHLMQRTDSFEKTLVLGKMRAGEEGDNRAWDGWMASLIQWTWVWVNSRSWWWIGRPGVLQFMGSQRVRHDWATELNNNNKRRYILCIWRVAILPLRWVKSLKSDVPHMILILMSIPSWRIHSSEEDTE